MSIGDRLKKIRNDARLSQSDIADLADVDKRTIQNYESEKNDVPSKILNVYASYCEDPGWLLTGVKTVLNKTSNTNHTEVFNTGPNSSTSELVELLKGRLADKDYIIKKLKEDLEGGKQ